MQENDAEGRQEDGNRNGERVLVSVLFSTERGLARGRLNLPRMTVRWKFLCKVMAPRTRFRV
jgi:hypothetical protein